MIILDRAQDSRSLAAQRARAERVLDEVRQKMNPRCLGHLPTAFHLVLHDDPCQTWVYIQNKHCVDLRPHRRLRTYNIVTTPLWLEEASDQEIAAVFAHEVAHAVNGDLEPDNAVQSATRYIAVVFTLFSFAALGVSIAQTTGFLDKGAWPVFAVAVGMPLLMLAALANLIFQSHRMEYRADAAAARLGYGPALCVDLSRDWTNTSARRQLLALLRLSTHPPMPARQRAMQSHTAIAGLSWG